MTPPPPALDSVLGKACASCKGWCCRDGREHAYLTAPRLRRHLDAHPGRSLDDVLAAYLGKSTTFDEAIGAFAQAYAKQTEADHAALQKAIKSGRVTAAAAAS